MSDVRTVAGLSELYIDKRDYANADTILDFALSTHSLNVTLLKLRVRDAYLAQPYEQVILSGERLVRLQDPSVTPLTWLALSYYDLQQYKDCIRICDYMLNIGFNLEPTYYATWHWPNRSPTQIKRLMLTYVNIGEAKPSEKCKVSAANEISNTILNIYPDSLLFPTIINLIN